MKTKQITKKQYRDAVKTYIATRGNYGELQGLPPAISGMWYAIYTDLVARHAIQPTRCDFDVKGRGSALNYDIYAAGLSDGQPALILQAREAARPRKNYYLQVRKTYALTGRNEDGTTYWHPIEAQVVHAAIRHGVDPIAAARAWMFGVALDKLPAIIRQGDVALVPVRAQDVRGEAVGTKAALAGSHRLDAHELRHNGSLYALDPQMVHEPGQHKPVERLSGWYRIVIAQQAPAWDFAPRSMD